MGCLLVIVALLFGVGVAVPAATLPGVPEAARASEVVVGRGRTGAIDWSVVARADGAGVCSELRAADSGGGGCVSSLPDDPFIVVSGTAEPHVVHGVVRDDVARVVVEGPGGTAVIDSLTSLAPIGLDARAFAFAIPEDVRSTGDPDEGIWLVALDADRDELGRVPGPG